MNRSTLKILIYQDRDYCLPHERKVDLGDSLSKQELEERKSYSIDHFSKEYDKFLKYLEDKNARVLASGPTGPESWNAVYNLRERDAILCCYFNKSELPKIGITVFSCESIEDKVKEIEKIFAGTPMRRD